MTAAKKKIRKDGSAILAAKRKRIQAYEFRNSDELKYVRVPGSVEEIRDYALSGCPNLSEAYLQEGIRYIGRMVFSGCPLLTEVVIPDSVEELGEFVLTDCPGLRAPVYNRGGSILYRFPASLPDKVFHVPFGVKRIGATAFAGNRELETVTIPDTVTMLEKRTFYESSVQEITVPASVTSIPAGFAVNCGRLNRVILKGNTRVDPGAFPGASPDLVIDGMRANENLWAQGKPLLRKTDFPLPDGSHVTEEFRKLADRCGEGDGNAMWQMGRYFEKYYNSNPHSFYLLALTYWKYQAYLAGNRDADQWFRDFEKGNPPGTRISAVLDETHEAERISGRCLNYLGYFGFHENRHYTIFPTTAAGVTQVCQLDREGNVETTVFYDSYLKLLPVGVMYRPGVGDPLRKYMENRAAELARWRCGEAWDRSPFASYLSREFRPLQWKIRHDRLPF